MYIYRHMKLIITESQARRLLINERDGNVIGNVTQKIGPWLNKQGKKTLDKVSKTNAGQKGTELIKQQIGNQTGYKMTPEFEAMIKQRFGDLDFNKDAPEFARFVETLAAAMKDDSTENGTDGSSEKKIGGLRKSLDKLNIPKGSKMLHPLGRRVKISSYFGNRDAPTLDASENHSGVDLSTPSGSPVYSPLNGKVTKIGDIGKCGGHVRIKHSDRLETLYCHLKRWDVKVGDDVKKGDIIGYSGGGESDPYRGISTGPHLHYAIVVDGNRVDPLKVQTNLV